jgi:hypothetical protein
VTGLDAFCAELRSALAGTPPELVRLETALHVLQISDNPLLIENHDDLSDIARRRLPLRTRVRRMLELMEQRQ